MMDLYCPICGEPWDNDSLHDEVAARRSAGLHSTYDEVAAQFRRQGCSALQAAFGAKCSEIPVSGTDRTFGLTRAEAAGALYDLLGDDMDGAASMLDDLGF